MKGWPQAIGAGLGYLAGGPIGALLGYIAGQRIAPALPSEQAHVLLACLLGFVAVLLKAQSTPATEDRQNTVRFISRLFRFDSEDEHLARQLLDQLLAVNLDMEAMASTFRGHTEPPLRRQLLEILLTVCRLRGPLQRGHLQTLARVASALHLEEGQWQGLTARYLQRSPSLDLDCCYALLGLYPDSPITSVKAAYRRLAKKYHPDRSVHLDHASQQQSADMMTLINSAYEAICAQQGRS
jgi:DnaJ like chaperone protein